MSPPQGTTSGANRYVEAPATLSGYRLPYAPSSDLAPAEDAPHQPRAVLGAANAVRRAAAAVEPVAAALRDARAAIPGAQFRGEGAAADAAHEKAQAAYIVQRDKWRRAAVALAQAISEHKSEWLAALEREQQQVRAAALLALASVQDHADRLEELALLVDGISSIHEGSSLGGIRLGAGPDMAARSEQRARGHQSDREHLASTVSSNVDSLISALAVRIEAPAGSEPGRAAW